ncbi:MAG: imidazoleglycerol-phosphate dehydratase HisB [Planctomycetota bacterium]
MARTASIQRTTGETDVRIELDLDGTGQSTLATGVGFFDHMLDLLARHALIDLTVEAKGDLHVDAHHTVEDVGLALGQALLQAIGDKAGIRRYGSAKVPMDEALAEAIIDLSGRPAHVLTVDFVGTTIGDFPVELVREFWKSFANAGKLNLHQHAPYGDNDHHLAEAIWKSTAVALRAAVEHDPRRGSDVPSTKGTLAD